MAITALRIVAVMLVALRLVPTGTHLLEMPAKMAMDRPAISQLILPQRLMTSPPTTRFDHSLRQKHKQTHDADKEHQGADAHGTS